MSHRSLLTDENIGDIITLIIRLEKDYNPEIGPFENYLNRSVRLRLMYLASKKKRKREVETVPVHENIIYYPKTNITYNELIEKIRPYLYDRDLNILVEYIVEEDTLENIGKQYKLSSERIRQIVKESLSKLQYARL